MAHQRTDALDALTNGRGVDAINLDQGDVNATNSDDGKKKQGSLFGPNIGVVSSGPAWTNERKGKPNNDHLTPEVVQNWVAKSKETSQPTTTLQALVNLKRPTLRLSPLAAHDSSEDTPPPTSHQQQQHGLEFEYDADAPKCSISVQVYLHTSQPAVQGSRKITVFEKTVDGGFGNLLRLDDGAVLDLGKFEYRVGAGGSNVPKTDAAASTSGAEVEQPHPAVSDSATPAVPPPSASPVPPNNEPSSNLAPAANATGDRRSRRRFTGFNFRLRAVTGPALPVVDADAPSAQQDVSNSPAATSSNEKNAEDEEGVRVVIRLVALDERGAEMESVNEQVTYLHLARFGKKNETANVKSGEDARPWVVRVVKREATIGSHTFQLHEIYGLTSHSKHSHSLPPPTPLPTLPTTYPPSSTQPATAAQTQSQSEEHTSECLLCLSSPREVVLLPCRHLVACRDCALNMIEFGAGGSITQPTDEVGAATETPGTLTGAEGAGSSANTDVDVEIPAGLRSGANGEGNAAGATTSAAGTPTPTLATTIQTTNPANPSTRRKRKAKGWFCPVCRQPYTSLLRITTSAPVPIDKERDSESTTGEVAAPAVTASAGGPSAAPPTPTPAPATTETRNAAGGRLANFRPSFLRGFGTSRNRNNVQRQQPDLERGTAEA